MSKDAILACGYHDQKAPRHSNMRTEMEKDGYTVIECHTHASGLIAKLFEIHRCVRTQKREASIILLTFPGHHLLPFMWVIAKIYGKKLWFDIFFSIHEIAIDDRKRFPKWHPKALFLWLLDFLGCHLPDTVILDTKAHKEFFVQKFNADPGKIRVIYVGTRKDLFYPEDKNYKKNVWEVLFYGTYIPHQGIEYIVRAAKIIERSHSNIHFSLIGKGQTYPDIERLAQNLKINNVTFLSSLPYDELANRVRDADMCLGVFGKESKIQHVISHKVFDAVACHVPILTAESRAVREKFDESDGVYFCKGGDPEAIAQEIITIYTTHHDHA